VPPPFAHPVTIKSAQGGAVGFLRIQLSKSSFRRPEATSNNQDDDLILASQRISQSAQISVISVHQWVAFAWFLPFQLPDYQLTQLLNLVEGPTPVIHRIRSHSSQFGVGFSDLCPNCFAVLRASVSPWWVFGFAFPISVICVNQW
jgi:hypothetical protein